MQYSNDARFAASLMLSSPPRLEPSRDALGGLDAGRIDWEKWSRHVEGRRRRLGGQSPFRGKLTSPTFLAEASYVSFKLEGFDVSEPTARWAMMPSRSRALRSRESQRLRNHAALVRWVDRAVVAGQAIGASSVLRWYAAVSGGLCPPDPGEAPRDRLERVVQRINSPELRPAPAVQEIARVHAALLGDPLFPSFNGIVARLLMRYHLGRCLLPPVIFHPATPPAALGQVRHLLPLILEQLEHSFDLLLG